MSLTVRILIYIGTGALLALALYYVQWRTSNPALVWGAYVGDPQQNLSAFETLVDKKPQMVAVFVGWDAPFPTSTARMLAQNKQTMLIFWEPVGFGYDNVIDGSHDAYIQQFAADAAASPARVVLAPFDEMNLNESDWGYGVNGNTAQKFVEAWRHVHGFFTSGNVTFALTYNSDSLPDTADNSYDAYYPGDKYVNIVGVDGFNFNNPPKGPGSVFDKPMRELQKYRKPLYILSTADTAGPNKAQWIAAFGEHIQEYPNLKGWVWFNENKQDGNWLVNSDEASLSAFKKILP
jgi:hypothetical protein